MRAEQREDDEKALSDREGVVQGDNRGQCAKQSRLGKSEEPKLEAWQQSSVTRTDHQIRQETAQAGNDLHCQTTHQRIPSWLAILLIDLLSAIQGLL